ncbi:MAG TPA: ATP-binding cassette domain-containing protein, partial [Acidimicrobiales bacterium]|nr:ATP-binding cassette domain-containing protein [Acidimicrobiales bacterium]
MGEAGRRAVMALVVDGLVIEYETGGYPFRPVDGLGFTAPPGTLSLLLGPSGCGKTSVLSALSGILRPKAGSILVGSAAVTSMGPAELTDYRRHGVGIVFQAFNLVPSLSGMDNVALPLRAAGRSRAEARRRAGELLARVGLADVAARRPGAMSGGQQQRVAIARALVLDPELIVADEPTAHLDYVQVEEVLRLLQELATAGRTVVVSTHDKRLVPLADQVIEMVPDSPMGTVEQERLELEPGDVIFRQGSWGELVYVVESGEVEIV